MDSRWPGEEEAALIHLRAAALQATDVPVVLCEAGPGTPVVWANDAYTRATGWTCDELVGRAPAVLRRGGPDAGAVDALHEALRSGTAATAMVIDHRKDGTSFWNQVSLSPVHLDGTLTHWISAHVEVTDYVDVADSLRRSVSEERRARAGLTLLVQVSDLLADTDDPFVLREISALLRRDMVAWAGFFLDEGGVLRPADGVGDGTVRRSANRPAVARAKSRATAGQGVPWPDPVADLLADRTFGPVVLDPRTVASETGGPFGPATLRLLEALRLALGEANPGTPPVVLAPVPGRGSVLGVLAVVPPGGPGRTVLDEDALTILRLVARRVGTVLENQRLHAQEHDVAEALQRAMLPGQAQVEGLDVWTYYAPSSRHAQVGGDWYDVLEAGSDHIAVVIGDVVGHDIEAAATMGQLRSIVRAYAYESADPAEVLRRVDEVVAGMRMSRAASVALVTLVRGERDWFARYARAGHLPPLLVRGEEVVQLREATGVLIGFGTGERHAATAVLEPGDVLVLYTDGLVERRGRKLGDGVAALVEAARGVAGLDAAGVGEELLQRLAAHAEDDVAVVVVRVPDTAGRVASRPGATRRRRWSLAHEPASIGLARRAVVRACEQWGVAGVSSAELVVSELVANAVMHGWGRIVLRLFDTGNGVRIEVEDANPAPPVPTDGHTGRVGGYGMRIVERLGDWGWRPVGRGKVVWARVRPGPFEHALDRTVT